MHDLSFLQDLTVIFAIAVVVVAVLQRVGVPPIAGFIVAGVLVGPHSLALTQDPHSVDTLAEVGVVLLLFSIGMELSLEQLRRLWRPILTGGALQMLGTTLVVVPVALWLGSDVGMAIFLGFVITVSSTAIVLRGLGARGELDAPHGRFTLGILVFQDLSVVPMMLALPLLAGGSAVWWEPLRALGLALGLLAAVLVSGVLLVPRLLHLVSLTRQRELFVLMVFLICAATTWVLSLVGVPLSLGAFLAGLVVAGSEYRHQALSNIIPVRELLTSMFFVSVGMFLNPIDMATDAPRILALMLAIVLGKFLVMFLVGALMRLPVRVCILSGSALAQVGEFSFVLMTAAQDTPLLPPALQEPLLSAVVLSMLVTPLAIALGPHLAGGAGRLRLLTRLMGVRTPEESHVVHHIRDHVLIAGYGVAGRELARALKASNIPYIIADLNAETVRRVAREREPIVFADVSSPEVLEHLGLHHAREFAILINDPAAAMRAIAAARQICPNLPIMVRARYLGDVQGLRRAGANTVVAAEVEAAVEITSRVLHNHRVDAADIERHLEGIRALRSETVGKQSVRADSSAAETGKA